MTIDEHKYCFVENNNRILTGIGHQRSICKYGVQAWVLRWKNSPRYILLLYYRKPDPKTYGVVRISLTTRTQVVHCVVWGWRISRDKSKSSGVVIWKDRAWQAKRVTCLKWLTLGEAFTMIGSSYGRKMESKLFANYPVQSKEGWVAQGGWLPSTP